LERSDDGEFGFLEIGSENTKVIERYVRAHTIGKTDALELGGIVIVFETGAFQGRLLICPDDSTHVRAVIGRGRASWVDLHESLDQLPMEGSSIATVLRQGQKVAIRILGYLQQKFLVLHQDFKVLLATLVLGIAEAHDFAEVPEIEASLDAAGVSNGGAKSRMIAIDSGIQNRPSDFTAIDLEQSFRRIRLHRRNRLPERRHRVAIERDLKDQRLSLLWGDLD